MSSMENQYLKENPRGAAVLYFTIALGILVTLAVLLRFMARRCIKAAFAADDWWILGSLVPLYGMIILGALCITWGGLGRPIAGHSPSQIAVFLKLMMASMVTYSLTITCVKLSLLVLYRRIFDTTSFKRRSIIVGTACIAWFIVAIFTDIFQCRPIEAAYDAKALFTNKCIDLQAYYWGITASNMCLDLVLLCLPLHMVWNLHLPPKRKWGVAAMFSLGGFGCIAGILRIIYISDLEKQDVTYSLINEYVWSQIEPAVAILCGCLVTYRPLFRNMTLSLPKQLQRFSHSSQTGNPSEDTPSTKERDLEFKWPAARGLRGQALSYQGLYSKVNKNGVHVYNINPPSSQVETTCRVSISKFAKEVTNKPQSITVTRENSITVNTEI